MSSFDRLHPALKRHIVNSMGFRSLRPLQESAIDPILDGEHALLIAPTAGGKTEAAMLPILSRMLSEAWPGLSVIYVCPIKALLNNLEGRLRLYAGYVGRRVELWHGDVKATKRKRILADPPDLLLTTPESLEVILTSSRSKKSTFLQNLRAVIVDEIHAFAGDDRGWHLLAVLERVERKSGRPLQRLGLSATVGNPDELLEWLVSKSEVPARVVVPADTKHVEGKTQITLDHVGNLENAATVISRLHRGEKRLVFCDSRYRVEKLAARLRQLKVDTYVSHSSLSFDERRRSEEAFAEKSDCVIVATSTLELGIDVGDLDRVIQIDSPSTVSSFLQRLGRTGRRQGSTRNGLFLTTSPDAFLYAAGLIKLWARGYVEPITPPPDPHHVLVQQLLGLILQEGGVGRNTWPDWLRGFAEITGIGREGVREQIDFMLEAGFLVVDNEILHFGPETDRHWSHRNYMDLCSVFASEPLFTVFYSTINLGSVHPISFFVRNDQPPVLLLAGRSWKVNLVDWPKERVYVEPTEMKGRSKWMGGSQPASHDHCQAVREVMVKGEIPATLTERAENALAECLAEFEWVDPEATTVFKNPGGGSIWCTFAGMKANAMLGTVLGNLVDETKRPDNLGVSLSPGVDADELEQALSALAGDPPGPDWVSLDKRALDSLKFAKALPPEVAGNVLQVRGADVGAVRACLAEPRRYVAGGIAGRRPDSAPR